MDRLPLISIVVPVYKVEMYLNKCIESITNQTYKNLEIILVDDGSPDKCPQFCDEWADKDSRIVVIHKENSGVSTARNAALDIAKGEYITFVDSDDTVDEKLIETLYVELIKNKADCSICNMKIVTESSSAPRKSSEQRMVLGRNEIIKEVLLCGVTEGFAWGKLFKSEYVSNLRFAEDIHYAEDELFVVQALLGCERIVFTPEPLYNYLQRKESVTGDVFNEKTYTICVAIDRMKNIFLKYGEKELYEVACCSRIKSDIYLLQKLYLLGMRRSMYCKKFQKSIRENITLKRLKNLSLLVCLEATLICVSLSVFYIWIELKTIIKKLKGVG